MTLGSTVSGYNKLGSLSCKKKKKIIKYYLLKGRQHVISCALGVFNSLNLFQIIYKYALSVAM